MPSETRFDLQDVGPCKKQVRVTVPADAVHAAMEESYRTLRAQVVLPGFRPGRVPRGVLERRFGEHVRHEVTHDLVQKSVETAIRDHKLDVLSEPELDLGHGEPPEAEGGEAAGGGDHHDHLHVSDNEPFSFSFTVEVKPEFELPPYRGVEVVRRRERPTEEALARVLERAIESRAEWKPVEGAKVEASDLVTGLLTVRDGDEVLVSDELLPVLSDDDTPGTEHISLPKLHEALLGHAQGETVEVPALGAEDHPREELRGKILAAAYEIEVVKRREVPVLDDAFAASLGFADLEALRADARMKLEAELDALADRKVVEQIIDKLVAATTIPLAEGPVEHAVTNRLKRLALELMIEGKDRETAQAEAETQRAVIRESVERDARSWFLLEKIAKKEKIFCLEEDLDEAFARIAREHGSTPTKVREYYHERGLLGELRNGILERKACEFLREHARMTEEDSGSGVEAGPPPSSDEAAGS